MKHENEIKKRLIIFFMLIICFSFSYGQFDDINYEIDSIKSILDKKSSIDSSSIKNYYDLGVRYFRTNKLILAENSIKKSIRISNNYNQDSLNMFNYQVLGIIKSYQSIPDSSIYYLKKANKVAHKYLDSSFISNIYLLIANIYTKDQKDYTNGYKYLDSGEFFLKPDQVRELTFSKNVKGNLLYELLLFDEALIQFKEGLKLAKINNLNTSPFINNIANVYLKTGDLSFAQKKITESINSIEINSFEDSTSLAINYYTIGSLLVEKKQYDSALFYVEKSKSIFKRLYMKNEFFNCQITLSGSILYQLNKKRSIELYHNIDTTNLDLTKRIQYESLGLKLGLIKPNVPLYKKYIEAAFKNSFHEIITSFSFETYTYYKKQHDFSNAILFNEYYLRAKDSILSIEKIIDVQKIKVKDLLDEKNEIILKNNIQKIVLNDQIALSESRKLFWLLISLASILIIIFLYFLLKKNIKLKKHLSLKNNELEQSLLKISEEIKNKNKVIGELEKLSFGSEIVKEKLIKDLNTESDWAEYILKFESLHPKFIKKLAISSNNELSNTDLRLASLIKLNLSNKEIAEIMYIAVETVKKSKQRLKKKLGLKTEERVTDFIRSF